MCSFGCIFVQLRCVEFLKLKELHTVEQCEEENQVRMQLDMGKFRPNCRKSLQNVEKKDLSPNFSFRKLYCNHSNMPISNPSRGPSLKRVVILAILNSKYSIQSTCFFGGERGKLRDVLLWIYTVGHGGPLSVISKAMIPLTGVIATYSVCNSN